VLRRLVDHCDAINAAFQRVVNPSETVLKEEDVLIMQQLLVPLEQFYFITQALGRQNVFTLSQFPYFISILFAACEPLPVAAAGGGSGRGGASESAAASLSEHDLVREFKEALRLGLRAVS
jgi:hypothetical protein